ncbi:hypothetical protein T4A_14074 [Trichinella pseudospiralis]|uniref:Uncharacterized protein n=1 Tax=Trichinella pseudospiralis TaxID=6337 RepID=A0A0V1ELD7_TRIPS|nr:hypothetical protein T4A_14074 [Trichinella pseudospiralis]
MNGICSILKNVILSNVGLYSLSENLRAIEICLPLRLTMCGKHKDRRWKPTWLSAFERFHVPCLVEMSLGFICGKRNG